MSSANTRVMTAHVPLPLAEQVDQLAAKLDRSRGGGEASPGRVRGSRGCALPDDA